MIPCSIWCPQGQPAECVLICRPQDFSDHEARIRDDEHRRVISKEACHRQVQSHHHLLTSPALSDLLAHSCVCRQVASLTAERKWAENVSCCRRQLLAQHWGEMDTAACGKCDVCLRFKDEPDPVRVCLGDVTILLLLMLEDATKARPRGDTRGAKWDSIMQSSMHVAAPNNHSHPSALSRARSIHPRYAKLTLALVCILAAQSLGSGLTPPTASSAHSASASGRTGAPTCGRSRACATFSISSSIRRAS